LDKSNDIFVLNNSNNGMKSTRLLKLHQLETFVEVARHKSVTKAAESLNLTQPAVTRTLRELESICGTALVAKDGRGIRITPQGETFLRHAGASLAAARNGLTAVADLNGSDRPAIRIGALPTVSALIMPGAVSRYLAEDLRNPLRISTGENRALLDQLRAGELDLVMGRLPAPESMTGLVFEPLYRDIVVFAVHNSHPLAGRSTISAAEISSSPMLVPTSVSIIGPFVKRLFIEQGLPEPAQVIETVSDSFGRAFTRGHGAIWIISRGVIAAELDSGEFVALPINTQSTLGAVGLCMKAGEPLEPAVEIFANILREEVKQRADFLPEHVG
jgi:LysR family transcriptional regulator, pca operon transcriptional activator